MQQVFDNIFSITFFLQSIRITIPYFLPSLGATFSEKGGVVNIALEGILLVGAFFTTVGTYLTQNIFIGVLCGIISGFIIALFHAIATISLKADQIVSGLALNIFSLGLTKFLCKVIFNSSNNSERIPGLENLNIFKTFVDMPFLIFCILIIFISYIIMQKTRFGLRLKAVGENPTAADSLGISVNKIRYFGVLISGILTGLGGAWLAFNQHSFTDGMSAGRGYIALAAMIIGKWNPVGAAGACLLFGLAESFSIQFQSGIIPTQFIQMIPYILTIIVLAGFIGKSTPPEADGIPFDKE